MERVPGDTSVLPIPASEKGLVRNLMQAYRHDLSEFDGASPDESGSYGVGSYFDAYWTEPVRYPFKVLVGDVLAGFALVRELAPQTYCMAEFFILRRHRKSGVGREAAFALFRKFPGTWHVAEDEHNLPAQRFWRSIIDEHSGGDFTEEWSESQPRGPKQVFVAGGLKIGRDHGTQTASLRSSL